MMWVLASVLSGVSAVLAAPDMPNDEAVAYVVITVVVLLIVCLLPCYSALLHGYWHGQTALSSARCSPGRHPSSSRTVLERDR